jgi:UDP-N-acetylmuramate--alanine ligase
VAFGTDPAADWSGEVLERGPSGQRVLVRHHGEPVGELMLGVPGAHNVRNALAALATSSLVGVPFDVAAEELASFGGVQRRFQLRGSVGGVTVIDDYAHHPTEVRVTLEAAREQGWARLVAVFQPHRYSRTQLLGRDLGAALAGADLAVITDVYGAGEQPVPGVTGKSVVDGLLAARPRARVAYLPKRGEVADFVAGRVDPGDLVLTIGAGDITMLADEVLQALTERAARKGAR